MRSFTDTFIRHPVLAVVVNLAIVLVGWRALSSLPVQQYPNIQSSSVVISTVYYGASAEAVRGFLTTPIERAVSAISGIDYVGSNSRAGVSTVTVHLKLNQNSTAALPAVGQTKGNLVQVNLLANTDLRSTSEFENLIVTDRDGAVVRLSDVAKVELGAEEADMIAKFNDEEAVYLGVWPTIGSNEIEVSHRLHTEIARITPTLPPDIQLRVAYDGTIFMQDALKEITKTLMETILIVALVVFLFLGSIRTALVPLVAMPVSLIGAGVVMTAFGFSLNLLTILAIVLSVGLVVDDAIVVVENVERHVRLGKTRLEAALVGARELVGPIIAMTITLAAVYAPIGFQGGLTGSLFLEFAITLAAAVVVSGVVAVTLSPVMSSRFVNEKGREGRL